MYDSHLGQLGLDGSPVERVAGLAVLCVDEVSWLVFLADCKGPKS